MQVAANPYPCPVLPGLGMVKVFIKEVVCSPEKTERAFGQRLVFHF
jgi:hypothetical protein